MNGFHCLPVIFTHLLICEATRPDLSVEVIGLVNVAGKNRHAFKVQTEALRKELLHAYHVACEVVLSVRVPSRCHLWEIDYRNLLVVINQQVELIEVTMYEAMLCQPDDLFD